MLPIVRTYQAITQAYTMAAEASKSGLEEAFKYLSSIEPKKNIQSFPERLKENLTQFIANSATAVLTENPKERQKAIQTVMEQMPMMSGVTKPPNVLGGFEQKLLKKTTKSIKVKEIDVEDIAAAPAPKKFPTDAATLRRRSMKRVK